MEGKVNTVKPKNKCKICGTDTVGTICAECRLQVTDFFIDAVASSVEWMNISYEKAVDLGKFVLDFMEGDDEYEEDVKNEIAWRKKNGKSIGTLSRG